VGVCAGRLDLEDPVAADETVRVRDHPLVVASRPRPGVPNLEAGAGCEDPRELRFPAVAVVEQVLQLGGDVLGFSVAGLLAPQGETGLLPVVELRGVRATETGGPLLLPLLGVFEASGEDEAGGGGHRFPPVSAR